MLSSILRTTPDALRVYWILIKITVPIVVVVECLSRLGVVEAISPVFAPVMGMLGLPSELGLAFLMTLMVGLWGGLPLLFVLVPVETLSVADVTVFSSLILIAHALPVEQKIISQVGPRFAATTVLRLLGGLLYAFFVHCILSTMGWLQEPVQPSWVPLSETQSWFGFFTGLGEAMMWMAVILVALFWGLELLKQLGLIDVLMKAIHPILRLCGIKGEAAQLTTVGLLLGISYGAGVLIREVEQGHIPPRQILLSCIFMGLAHSAIEDTLLVMAVGASGLWVLGGRIIFAIAAVAVMAAVLQRIPDRVFYAVLFRAP